MKVTPLAPPQAAKLAIGDHFPANIPLTDQFVGYPMFCRSKYVGSHPEHCVCGTSPICRDISHDVANPMINHLQVITVVLSLCKPSPVMVLYPFQLGVADRMEGLIAGMLQPATCRTVSSISGVTHKYYRSEEENVIVTCFPLNGATGLKHHPL